MSHRRVCQKMILLKHEGVNSEIKGRLSIKLTPGSTRYHNMWDLGLLTITHHEQNMNDASFSYLWRQVRPGYLHLDQSYSYRFVTLPGAVPILELEVPHPGDPNILRHTGEAGHPQVPLGQTGITQEEEAVGGRVLATH